METLALSFAAALTIVGAAFCFQLLMRRRRRARLKGLELKPNCLLTRRPIAFVTRSRSLFSWGDPMADDVPGYLEEHGYDVLVVELPRKAADPARALIATLDAMRASCHLIASTSHRPLFETIANQKHPMVTSLTVIEDPEAERDDDRRPSLDDYKPLASAVETFVVARDERTKRPFGFEARILDLAISLAERDTMLND